MQFYTYNWGPRLRIPGMDYLDRKGQRCSVLARGAMNSCCVQFDDGHTAIVSRNALRTRVVDERQPSLFGGAA